MPSAPSGMNLLLDISLGREVTRNVPKQLLLLLALESIAKLTPHRFQIFYAGVTTFSLLLVNSPVMTQVFTI